MSCTCKLTKNSDLDILICRKMFYGVGWVFLKLELFVWPVVIIMINVYYFFFYTIIHSCAEYCVSTYL